MYVCHWFLDAVSFTKQQSGRAYYNIQAYMELFQFLYCLLTRSRKFATMSELNAWDDYMDVSKIVHFDKSAFRNVLRQAKGGEAQEFRN